MITRWFAKVLAVARDLGWMLVALAVICAGAGAFLVVEGITRIIGYTNRIPGVLIVEDCRWETARFTSGNWACSGTFRSTDGTVEIGSLPLRQGYDSWPSTPVDSWVTDPAATEALTSVFWIPLPAGLAFTGVAVFFARPIAGSVKDESPAVHEPRPALATAAMQTPPEKEEQPVGKHERLPPNRTLLRVLAWYGIFMAATAGMTWSWAEEEREHDVPRGDLVVAVVTGVQLGAEDRIAVEWEEPGGLVHAARFTPVDPDAFSVGDMIELRYEPGDPTSAGPVQYDDFEQEIPDRIVWIALVALLPGGTIAVLWTWQLFRWILGRRRPAHPVRAGVYASVLTSTPGTLKTTSTAGTVKTHGALWLKIEGETGGVRLQRVVWSRRLADLAIEKRPVPALARRCPGLLRMYIVDIPGVGRCWPAGRARVKEPAHISIEPLDPGPRGFSQRSPLVFVSSALALCAMAGFFAMLAGPAAAGYIFLLFAAGWHCWGAVPLRGPRGKQGKGLRIRGSRGPRSAADVA